MTNLKFIFPPWKKKHMHYHNGSERNFHHDEFSFFQIFSRDGHLFAKHLFPFSRQRRIRIIKNFKSLRAWKKKSSPRFRNISRYKGVDSNTVKSRGAKPFEHLKSWNSIENRNWKISTLRKFEPSTLLFDV